MIAKYIFVEWGIYGLDVSGETAIERDRVTEIKMTFWSGTIYLRTTLVKASILKMINHMIYAQV